jgi:hypothetical protein
MDWDRVVEITPQNAIAAFGAHARGASLPTTAWGIPERDDHIHALFDALSLPAAQKQAWQDGRTSGGAV